MTKVLLVGCGKMGGALAERWQKMRICEELVIVDPASQAIKSYKDIPTRFRPDVMVFAVKPQLLSEVIADYKIYKNALVISIAAGKPVSFFEMHLDTTTKIVRSMPNLPAAIGQGITVAYANKNVTAGEKDQATLLLGAVGEVLWVEKETLLTPSLPFPEAVLLISSY